MTISNHIEYGFIIISRLFILSYSLIALHKENFLRNVHNITPVMAVIRIWTWTLSDIIILIALGMLALYLFFIVTQQNFEYYLLIIFAMLGMIIISNNLNKGLILGFFGLGLIQQIIRVNPYFAPLRKYTSSNSNKEIPYIVGKFHGKFDLKSQNSHFMVGVESVDDPNKIEILGQFTSYHKDAKVINPEKKIDGSSGSQSMLKTGEINLDKTKFKVDAAKTNAANSDYRKHLDRYFDQTDETRHRNEPNAKPSPMQSSGDSTTELNNPARSNAFTTKSKTPVVGSTGNNKNIDEDV